MSNTKYQLPRLLLYYLKVLLPIYIIIGITGTYVIYRHHLKGDKESCEYVCLLWFIIVVSNKWHQAYIQIQH